MDTPPPPPPTDLPNRKAARATVFARQVQVLGYSWNGLSPGDAHRILTRLEQIAAGVPSLADLPRIEAALGIASSFFTGRNLVDLAPMQWTSVERWGIENVPFGLVRCAESWGWYIPSGQAGRPKPELAEKTLPLWLPAPKLVSDLAELGLKSRKKLREREAPLFETDPHELVAAAKEMLREDPALVRRAGTTLEAVQRWFFDAIRRMSGGDAALAQLITARAEITSKSTSFYTSCTQEQVEDAWWEVFGSFTGERLRRAPESSLRQQRYGSAYVPSDQLMQALAANLRAAILAAPTIEERHNAMTLYSLTLCSVGLALRPANRPVLRINGIDQDTGFLAIEDDRRRDPFMVRLSWAPPVVRLQVQHYRDHLDAMESSCPQAAALLHESSPEYLPIFLYEKGRARPKVLFEVMKRVCYSTEGLEKENFARHYVRTHLLGRCSSETLQAFLGHWNSGSEPFGIGSGFDPLLYRADLERSLPPLLDQAGWVTQASDQ